VRSFGGNSENVEAVAFSPDGGVLAYGQDHGTVTLWDVASGKLLRSVKDDDYSIGSVAFSPDGTVLAARGVFAINPLPISTGKLFHSLQGQPMAPIMFSSMAFSPDGTKIASGNYDHTVRLWDAASASLLRTFEGHSDDVKSVAFSPDGTVLASASSDKTVKLWDVTSGPKVAGAFPAAVPLLPKGEVLKIFGMSLTPGQSSDGAKGVVVAEIDPSSEVAEKGLKAGDVILEVSGLPVSLPKEFATLMAVSKKMGDGSVLVQFQSGHEKRFMALHP
jgi:FOG: WD40 repeat